MDLYYSDTFELPLPEGHRFPMSKYRLLREKIAAASWNVDCRFVLPEPASDQDLKLAHTADYVDRATNGLLSELEIRRIGFPWSPLMIERSRRSSGGSIGAGRSALREGIAANLAGGTHHAGPDAGQGFCVFNDVCVAARVLQKESRIERALLVDCDVHQGNGSAAIAAEDETIFTFSIHCSKNFPFRKGTSDLDVELPAGTEDLEYLSALNRALQAIETDFSPDLVFYLAGADPFSGDRLGQFRLSKVGLLRRDRFVLDFYRNRGIPVAISMAGGYAPNVHDIVDIHFATIHAAWIRWLQDGSDQLAQSERSV